MQFVKATDKHAELLDNLKATALAWLETVPCTTTAESTQAAQEMLAIGGQFLGSLFAAVPPDRWPETAELINYNMKKVIQVLMEEAGMMMQLPAGQG